MPTAARMTESRLIGAGDLDAPFANLLTPLAMLVMFVGEYLLRYRLHPEFERATLAQAVRAYADRGSHD